jgi:hypothetical protein
MVPSLFATSRRRVLLEESEYYGNPDGMLYYSEGLTYKKIMKVIEADVGPTELAFRAALRTPLPPSTQDELSLKSASQFIIHIPSIEDLKRAVIDMVKVSEFSHFLLASAKKSQQ